ncbi:hypothetical protein M405DRAFT_806276 [Rhizopogon salebrosus TDB-379]|nr:hypothetical protein M405DRAFT_806276 [Rhizopogon salebrosus TDB-379]
MSVSYNGKHECLQGQENHAIRSFRHPDGTCYANCSKDEKSYKHFLTLVPKGIMRKIRSPFAAIMLIMWKAFRVSMFC